MCGDLVVGPNQHHPTPQAEAVARGLELVGDQGLDQHDAAIEGLEVKVLEPVDDRDALPALAG
jgi:hypothetical protein